mmetsp:Transcript_6846/g.28004  ORF Transcript_6846/g.28004 Transcript_6846/m.28004 type:complete len:252 (-) Transcript_6846:1120-1875(-)
MRVGGRRDARAGLEVARVRLPRQLVGRAGQHDDAPLRGAARGIGRGARTRSVPGAHQGGLGGAAQGTALVRGRVGPRLHHSGDLPRAEAVRRRRAAPRDAAHPARARACVPADALVPAGAAAQPQEAARAVRVLQQPARGLPGLPGPAGPQGQHRQGVVLPEDARRAGQDRASDRQAQGAAAAGEGAGVRCRAREWARVHAQDWQGARGRPLRRRRAACRRTAVLVERPRGENLPSAKHGQHWPAPERRAG